MSSEKIRVSPELNGHGYPASWDDGPGEKDRILLRWGDRLLTFKAPEIAEELGLDLAVDDVKYRRIECQGEDCGSYLAIGASTTKDHPYGAMKAAMSSASRSLAKVAALDEKVFISQEEHINFQFMTLTFPPELQKITEAEAWRVFKRFWRGPKKKPGKKKAEDGNGARWRCFRERNFGAAANFHFWHTKNPLGERFAHFHINLAMLGVTIKSESEAAVLPSPIKTLPLNQDSREKIEDKKKRKVKPPGRVVRSLEVEFKPEKGYLSHSQVRQAWADAITAELGYKFDEKKELSEQLVANLDYYNLGYPGGMGKPPGKAQLLHNLKYATRRVVADMGCAANKAGWTGRYLERLTARARIDPGGMLALWRSQNRTRTYGWWRRMKTITGDVEASSRCPICGDRTKYLGDVPLSQVDLQNCEFIILGKRGKVKRTASAPSWLRVLVAERGG